MKDDYQPLIHDAGFAPLEQHSFLRLTGTDRMTFLHGLCTNDIKRLAAGQGCEVFFTTVQGKTLAFGWVFAHDDVHEIELATADGAALLRHLDKYLIREDVQLEDATNATAAWLIAGPAAPQRLAAIAPVVQRDGPIASIQGSLGNVRVAVQVLLADPFHVHLVAPGEARDVVEAALEALGIARCSARTAEIRRIESGLPHGPEEITTDHLPQELDRNDTAISFTKGCYLGQETVARLDALGHVNRRLMGLLLPGNEPFAAGTELSAEGKAVARITSSAYSPLRDRAIALAFVRRGYDRVGQLLDSSAGPVEVTALPFLATNR